MRRTVLTAIAVLLASAAPAPSALAAATAAVAVVPEFIGGLSTTAIFNEPGFFDTARNCFDRYPYNALQGAAEAKQQGCLAAYMKEHGASRQAIAFMRAAPVPAAISAMRRYGPVAVAHAAMMWADAADGWALIDQAGQMLPLWTPPALDHDPVYARFVAAHHGVSLWADALDWPVSVALPDGGTSLTFHYTLKVCHACATLGKAEIAYVFDRQGRYRSTRLVAIADQEAPAQ